MSQTERKNAENADIFFCENVTLNALRNPTTRRTYPHANTRKTIK